MKSVLPLLSFVILFASCTTVYKTGQTPDDVYFSPERPQEEYVRVDQRNDESYRNQESRSYNRYDDEYYDDRYLRMRIRNRRMWSDLDYYYSDPYAYQYRNRYNRYNYLNNYYWNPYSYWNYHYNPYNSQVVIVNPKSPVYNRPRTSNLHVFDSPELNTYNPKQTQSSRGSRIYGGDDSPIYNAPRRNTGNDMRSIFGNSSNNSSFGNNSPSRASENSGSRSSSGSSGSSSGSNSGGNAPVRKF